MDVSRNAPDPRQPPAVTDAPRPARGRSGAPRALGGCELFTAIAGDLALGCGVISDGPVVVAGAVGGGVSCPWVEIDRGARVAGAVEAEDAIVEGEVAGGVYGRTVVLGSSARVGGEVVCERLHAAPGAAVDGRTHPSLRLNRGLRRDLARIARSARAAEMIDATSLRTLLREGLVFEHRGEVFVSIYGHLELGRRWRRALGFGSGRGGDPRLPEKRPPQVAAYRLAAESAPAPLSVIGDDVRLESDLDTGGDLRIHGEVRGDVRCRHCATGDASRVDGSVTAQRAGVAGRVSGSLTASRVLLLTTARVAGCVNFAAIEARGGARYASARQIAPAAPGGLERLAPFRDAAAAIESRLRGMRAAA